MPTIPRSKKKPPGKQKKIASQFFHLLKDENVVVEKGRVPFRSVGLLFAVWLGIIVTFFFPVSRSEDLQQSQAATAINGESDPIILTHTTTTCRSYNLGGESTSRPAIMLFNNRFVIAIQGTAASGYGVYVKEWLPSSTLRDWYWVNTGATSAIPKLSIVSNYLYMKVKGYYGGPIDNIYQTRYISSGSWTPWIDTGVKDPNFAGGPFGTYLNNKFYTTKLGTGNAVIVDECNVPTVGTISPSSGSKNSGNEVRFITTYSHPDGWTNLEYGLLLFNTTVNAVNAAYTYYNQNTNLLYIRNDAGTAWIGGCTPGSSTTIQNSYASLSCARTTISGSDTTLTVTWALTFKSPFVGAKNAYLYARADSTAVTGWIKKGTWTIGKTLLTDPNGPTDSKIWLAPINYNGSLYGPAGLMGSLPRWQIAQWGIGGIAKNAAQQLPAAAINLGGGAWKVENQFATVQFTPGANWYTLRQNSTNLNTGCIFPASEFDLLLGPNENRAYSNSVYPEGFIREAQRPFIGTLTSLHAKLTARLLNASHGNRCQPGIDLASALFGIVFHSDASNQGLFYQVVLYDSRAAYPNSAGSWYQSTPPLFGVSDAANVLGGNLLVPGGSVIAYNLDILGRVKQHIQNGPAGIDRNINNWKVFGAYYGSYTNGIGVITTQFSGIDIVAD